MWLQAGTRLLAVLTLTTGFVMGTTRVAIETLVIQTARGPQLMWLQAGTHLLAVLTLTTGSVIETTRVSIEALVKALAVAGPAQRDG